MRGLDATTRTWGSTVPERRMRFACDDFVSDPHDCMYRAVTVDAPPASLFRWLCQLRQAPYSYDWIDNLGRPSPRRLTPGLERLEVGQRMIFFFRLAAFEQNRHITLLVLDRLNSLVGQVAVTYLIVPAGHSRCRLVVKLALVYPRSLIGFSMRAFLPLGDLIMMRKQLLNLKELAEQQAATAPTSSARPG
jgi:hypothetical protein